MDPEKVKAALDAIEANDAEACKAILKELVASAAGGGAMPSEAGGPEELATETPADMPPKDKPGELQALALLTSITGTKDLKGAAVKLRSVVEYVDTARATNTKVDQVTRVALVGKLVKLGAETPASAWVGDGDKRTPCKRLAVMDLDDLQEWVTKLEADPTRKASDGHAPPESEAISSSSSDQTDVEAEVKKLSAPLLDQIKKKGMTPQDFIRARNASTRRIHG